jgi:hypothetical protein
VLHEQFATRAASTTAPSGATAEVSNDAGVARAA